MSDKPKASGPMWNMEEIDKDTHVCELRSNWYRDDLPYRALPGHGRWVPAELVAAIEVAAHEFDKVTPFVNDGVAAAWAQFVDVIRAAREGEV